MTKIVQKDVDGNGEKVDVEVPVEFFDYVNNILSERSDIMETEDDEKAYTPYMINRALSMNMDTVLYANEMNKLPTISKRMQYDYLRLAVRKGKRYNKWAKKETNEQLDTLCEYYECSRSKAVEMLKLLTEEQVKVLASRMYKGGTQK